MKNVCNFELIKINKIKKIKKKKIMKARLYPYLTISQAVKEENREVLPKKGVQ